MSSLSLPVASSRFQQALMFQRVTARRQLMESTQKSHHPRGRCPSTPRIAHSLVDKPVLSVEALRAQPLVEALWAQPVEARWVEALSVRPALVADNITRNTEKAEHLGVYYQTS